MAPKDRPGWNGRHKLLYANDNLNPNVRSYFDRWIDARPPGEEPEKGGVLKPNWRLNPDGQSEEDRRQAEAMLRSMSPQGPPSPKHGDSKAARRTRRPGPPERPWEQEPEPLDEDHEPRRPLPGGGGGSTKPEPLSQEMSEVLEEKKRVEEASKWYQAPAPGSYAAKDLGTWSRSHHILWCNEQKVGDYTRLNPMQFRSYFGRPREPDVGARSCAYRPARADGKGDEVSRVIPVWRLEPVPGSDQLPGEEELKVRPEVLQACSGTGGDPQMGQGSSASHLGSTGRSLSSPSLAGEQREQRWDGRHDLVFKNEEVSRLDRSYFDRFREPECVLPADQAKRKARGSVRDWSLQPEGNPAEVAKVVSEAGDRRFNPDGKWNARHHVMFYNRIHPNARSYFERMREPASEAAPKHLLEMADPTQLPGPAFRDPTAAAERRQRGKLGDSERLPVQWSLQELAGPKDRYALQDSLRRCDSEPSRKNPKQARKKERRRDAWFSSHGVVF